MNEKETAPIWLLYGLPSVLLLSGLISVITRTFWMAGGARGGTSKLIGMPAVYFGIGLMCLGIFFYSFVTIRLTMRANQLIRIVAWVSGFLTLASWALLGIVLGNR